MRKLLLSLVCVACVMPPMFAQMPDGYYTDADGKCGQVLRSALEDIIASHTQRSYDNLWTDFRNTDAREDGKVWDMYSCTSSFTFGTNQDKGSHPSEGYAYNREHSFPKSWFGGEVLPMYTDLYHLYPTDGYVNEKRGNNPFGEVGKATYSSANGFSKLGKSSTSGYTGTVFEPADEYKGDFARTYFYMMTCYASKVNSWSSDMLSGGDLSSWAVSLLLKWSETDAVSDKERNRIEAVYKIQGNRNPFIDCPGLEEYIWGKDKTTPVNISTLTGIVSATADATLKYRFSVSSGQLDVEAYNDNIPVVVYDIAGRAVVRTKVNRGAHTYPLQKGLYIVDGKKILVK